MKTMRKVLTYFVIAAVAFLSAVNYEIFIFPNEFAPSGINGICTMIQYVTGISVGYLSLLINIPLALWCYFEVSKPVALRSMVYVGAYSTDTSAIMGPLVGGIIQGFVFSILAKSSAYSGGTDFVSAIVHKRNPMRSVYGISFIMNTCIAICSYFVYDYKMEPVILCIIYGYLSSSVVDRLMKSGREAICFEIITEHPQEISEEIIRKTRHTTTLIPARGMYTGKEKSMLICVVNKTQAAAVARICRSYPNTFAVMDPVGEVMGNFKDLKMDGSQVLHVLDSGDGKTL